MPLVSSSFLLQTARKNGYCIGAFNIHTLEMLQAVVEAAEEVDSPLIIQSTVGTVKHLGAEYIAAAATVASNHSHVPIALHLDHCTDFDLILKCIRAGYTSVMIDASMQTFQENVAQTKKIVEIANATGVNVEAELGKVGGVEDEIVVAENESLMADPSECQEFVVQTGVHTLAPAIGTAHGIYKGEPKIDFMRLKRIADLVQVPLVLHGGSGIPEVQVRESISLGIAKMNIATELRNIFTNSIKEFFISHPDENDPRKYLMQAKQALKEAAIEKMRICGSIGKATDFRGKL